MNVIEKILLQNSDTVRDNDLLAVSLSYLAKKLSHETPSRVVMTIYLRWLEVHRRHPSNLTEQWGNTLCHWIQSLRARGFQHGEVAAEIVKWVNSSGASFSPNDPRLPPTPSDIAKAFGESPRVLNRNLREDISGQPSLPSMPLYPSLFDSPPKGSYVCNRCNIRGHHLQVCPTNMDPSYDRAPDDTYSCKACGAKGIHFTSLCLRNTDPHSINQKRRAAGITTSSPARQHRDRGTMRDNDLFAGHPERPTILVDRSRPRTSIEARQNSSQTNSPASSSDNSAREKLHEIEALKRRLERGDSVEAMEIENVLSTDEAVTSAVQERKRTWQESSDGRDDGDSSGFTPKEPENKRARHSSCRESGKVVTSIDGVGEQKTNSAFVHKLLESRPEMSKPLNRSYRPTAMDFWN